MDNTRVDLVTTLAAEADIAIDNFRRANLLWDDQNHPLLRVDRDQHLTRQDLTEWARQQNLPGCNIAHIEPLYNARFYYRLRAIAQQNYKEATDYLDQQKTKALETALKIMENASNEATEQYGKTLIAELL